MSLIAGWVFVLKIHVSKNLSDYNSYSQQGALHNCAMQWVFLGEIFTNWLPFVKFLPSKCSLKTFYVSALTNHEIFLPWKVGLGQSVKIFAL